MAIEDVIGDVLMSAACQGIDFTYGNISVNGNSYSAIALAILNKKIRVSVNSNLPASEAASYDAGKDQMNFRSNSYGTGTNAAFERQTIVHEATHAVIDAQYAKTRITQQTTEVAAFIAGSFYNMRAMARLKDAYGQTPPRVSSYIPSSREKIYKASHDVVVAMINRVARYNYQGSLSFDNVSAAPIITAIRADPLYTTRGRDPDKLTTTNGLRTRA